MRERMWEGANSSVRLLFRGGQGGYASEIRCRPMK